LGVGGSRVSLELGLLADCDVHLSVYDVAGRRLATLEDGRMSAGLHALDWDAAGIPRGIYFYRLRTDQGVSSGTITLQR
jgi:hypothetical protein